MCNYTKEEYEAAKSKKRPSVHDQTIIRVYERYMANEGKYSFQSQAQNFRTRLYTLSISHLATAKRLISAIEEMQPPKYAYILHDKDREQGDLIPPHYHFYLEFDNPIYVNSLARQLDIPANMIQKIISKRGILSYLVHDNQPEKYQYELTDVTANFDLPKETEYAQKQRKLEFFDDACDYHAGVMSHKDFVNKWQYTLCDIPFFQQMWGRV